MRSLFGPVVLAGSLVLLQACVSTRSVEVVNAENVIAEVAKGDTVRITDINGFRYEFVITKVTNKALYGGEQRVLYTDMAKIEVRKGEDEGNVFTDMTKAFKGLF